MYIRIAACALTKAYFAILDPAVWVRMQCAIE
jgi:hypothetical protein